MSKIIIKPVDKARSLSSNLSITSIKILLVGIQYSMHDLIVTKSNAELEATTQIK